MRKAKPVTDEVDESKWGPLEKSRKALRDIWQECYYSGFIGRCWSRPPSRIPRSNIILSDAQMIVVTYAEGGDRYGRLHISVFGDQTKSDLAIRVRQTLANADLIEPDYPLV